MLYPQYRFFGGYIKILSPCSYICVDLDSDSSMIEHQKDNAGGVEMFFRNGREITEQEFNSAFLKSLSRFTKIYREITNPLKIAI